MAEEAKIKVIIVDDIAETRENIRKLLQFEPDIEVVGVARTGAEGIEVTGEQHPDVVLMDVNMPDMDGITATEKIREKYPATQVVILSVQNDSNYLRKAMIAGAHDFLTKPPDIGELTSAIRRAGEKASEERNKEATTMAAVASLQAAVASGSTGAGGIPGAHNGKAIVVYSPKGGTGASTLVTNLAIAMHSEETPVLVIDGRLQFGDISFFFNEKSSNSVADLTERANELDQEVVDDVLITNEATGVKILAAPPRPEQAESVKGAQFATVIKYMKSHFKYVLIDTDSDLNDVTLSAIDIADMIVLIATQDIPSIKNITLLVELMEALGMPRHHLGVVVNRWDKKRSNVTPEKISEVLKIPLLGWLPADEKLTGPALDRGVPFYISNKNQPLSKAIARLGVAIQEKIEEIQEAEAEML